LPYPLLMNAFNNINLAGACILTSIEVARSLGVPSHKWIYALGGAGTRDAYNFWERPNFHSSPSISKSLDAALAVSRLTKDRVDMFDFYSCFPIVPKLACQHLGLPIIGSEKPITLLGGLTSFGGAGNNYSMHAIIEMTRRLRSGNGRNGLILANGGSVTYEHVICLSSIAPGVPYPSNNPLPENLEDEPHPEVEVGAEGEVSIETYTVQFERDGRPAMAFIVGRLMSNGKRILANDGDEQTLRTLANTTEEQIGKRGWIRKDAHEKGKSLFSFHSNESRL